MCKSYDAVYNHGCKTNCYRTAVQMQCTENLTIFLICAEGRQETAVISYGTFLLKPRRQTVVTSSAVDSIPAYISQTFFQVSGPFGEFFIFVLSWHINTV